MTKLLSTKETVRFVPPGTASGASDNAITYDLRVPTVYDRARLRRGCLARGARHWSDLEMMPVLEAGVRELLGSEAESELRDGFLTDIETYTAHLAANDEEFGSGYGLASIDSVLDQPGFHGRRKSIELFGINGTKSSTLL